MKHPKTISIQDFSYCLPDDKIAKYPLKKRDESKLLCFRNSKITQRQFKELPAELPSDTLLVYNNTKVIRARMMFYKETGAKIEIFCLEPHVPSDYALSFQQTKEVVWRCIVGNARKWKDAPLFMDLGNGVKLKADKIGRDGADFLIKFEWNNLELCFSDVIEKCGNIPIPPYLNRESEDSDLTTYQTVYAQYDGSVAAPTAGLHFTDEVLLKLKGKGVCTDQVTLHVGAGTFQPVKADKMAEHPMHTEMIAVSYDTIQNLKDHLGHVIAVGTTSVRTLESIYWLGALLKRGDLSSPDGAHIEQWIPYETQNVVLPCEALDALLSWMKDNKRVMFTASTQIIIAPGYEFKIIEGMLTNFHQPKSTLLLLVSALVGESWKTIYDYALNHEFRFLSYGDSSLLFKDQSKS